MNRERKPCPLSAPVVTDVIRRYSIALGVLAFLGGAASCAHGAGGHHAVDDATLLEPGQCQLETWLEHEAQSERRLLHAGSACRVSAVELGLNIDRARPAGTDATTGYGMQVKWAHAFDERWSAGAVLALAGQDRAPGYLGSTLVVPITWQVSETVSGHLNVGRDFRHGQPDGNRGGLALEWAPLTAWSFVAERFREGGLNLWRAGARWSLTPSTTLDLSRARGLNGSVPAWWTLGLSWVFER